MRHHPDAGGASPPTRGGKRRLALVWAAAAALVVAVVLLIYFWRGPIGARLTTAYLRARGVPAQVTIEHLGPSGFTARVVVGPPSDPDLVVEQMDATFEPGFLWRNGLAAPRIRSVRLVQPRLKLTFDGRRFSLGGLAPLVRALQPSGPATGPAPEIEIDQGEVRVLTPAGQLTALGDAFIQGGRLRSLDARLLPARLARGGLVVELLGGRADAWGVQHLRGALGLRLGRVRWTGGELHDVVVGLGLGAAYSGAGLNMDEPVTLAATAWAGSAEAGPLSLRWPQVRALFRGTVGGTASALRADGAGQLQAMAPSVAASGVKAQGASVDLDFPKLRIGLGRRSEAQLASDGRIGVEQVALRLGRSQAGLRDLRWSGGGEIAIAGKSLQGRLHGAGSARSGLDRASAARLARGLPMLGTEPRGRAAAASLLADGVLSAPDLDVSLAGGKLRATARRAVTLAAPSGSTVRLSQRPRAPLVAVDRSGARGAFDLDLAGPGLPRLRATVVRYSARPGTRGWSGDADLGIDASIASRDLEDVAVKAAGRLVFGRGRAAFTARDCAPVSATAVLNASRPVLQDASASICPSPGRPLWAMDRSGWSLAAQVRGAQARAPQLQVGVKDGDATVEVHAQRRGRPSVQAVLSQLVVSDLSSDPLFRPVRLDGRLSGAGGPVQGEFRVAEQARGLRLGVVSVRQDLASGAGEAQISAPDLRFDPQGLQPGQVFPVADALASQASGPAAFTGWARWSRGGLRSGGELKVDGLDFRSPLGRVQGLRTDVHFNSLLPLTTPAGQHATARTLKTVAELENARADFALTAKALQIGGASAEGGGGVLSVGRLVVPFAGDHATAGVLRFKDIDVGAILKSSSFADRISAQARVDGDVRFSASTSGFQILGGHAFATGPGRLSIRRAALTGVMTGGAPATAGANPMQNLAYQALENLAFDKLDAVIEPRPGGRLGIVFHIYGRHDPEQAPDARISLFDILRGRAFKKQIPLPKGTPINLTLDTSINFDELMREYLAATGGSAGVQP